MSYEIINTIHLGSAMQVHVIAENLRWLRDAEVDLMTRYNGRSASITINHGYLLKYEQGRLVGYNTKDNPVKIRRWVNIDRGVILDNDVQYQSNGTPINAIIIVNKG
jgi:hypothetical protein